MKYMNEQRCKKPKEVVRVLIKEVNHLIRHNNEDLNIDHIQELCVIASDLEELMKCL